MDFIEKILVLSESLERRRACLFVKKNAQQIHKQGTPFRSNIVFKNGNMMLAQLRQGAKTAVVLSCRDNMRNKAKDKCSYSYRNVLLTSSPIVL